MIYSLNQLPELIAFVRSVDTKSFSAAAKLLGTTPSAVSKRVAKLEGRLGARLLQRSTRSLSLTIEGTLYYERIVRLLMELKEADDLVMSGGKPRGKLRVSASLEFGHLVLSRWMPKFLMQYPEIQVELGLTARFVDLVEEQIDVAIRLGVLEDSSLIFRHLGTAQFAVCASPTYLNVHGVPQSPEQLMEHNCLRYLSGGHPFPWTFILNDTVQEIPVTGTFDSDSGDALRAAALAGLGITWLFSFQAQEDIQSQRLQLLFTEQLPPGLPVQAIFTYQHNLSPRVQVFLEFLTAESVKVLR